MKTKKVQRNIQMLKKSSIFRWAGLALLFGGLIVAGCSSSKKEGVKPNIVFILADDLG